MASTSRSPTLTSDDIHPLRVAGGPFDLLVKHDYRSEVATITARRGDGTLAFSFAIPFFKLRDFRIALDPNI
jgi:hypothetical protein